MIHVYFDGKCGLCSKEIRYYQKIAPTGLFIWQDIATDPAPLIEYNITQEAALRRLHAKDKSGRWHIGVDAFAIIWKELRYWSILAVIVKLPLINNLAHIAYNHFADYRFKRLEHCQVFIEK